MIPAIKVQTWGDDLRLPCLINAADTTGLLAELEPLRRPTIPFQSKHLPALKRDKWHVLRRPPGRERSGLVVVWPQHKCCIYISGDHVNKVRVALLRVRIDPQFFASDAGLTVFSATLVASARRLALEDTYLWKGRNVFADEAFSARWALAIQWLEHYCLLDPRLLSGVEVEMAKWRSLDSLKSGHSWDIQSEEPGNKRLFWIGQQQSPPTSPTIESPRTPAQAPTLEVGPLVAVATRDAGPEQWKLAAGDNTTLGRALVRTLAISEQLRSVTAATVRVEVVWNKNFSKWEITGLTDSKATMSGEKFAVAK